MGNPPLCRRFQVLRSFIIMIHSKSHLVDNEPPVQANLFHVWGYSEKSMTFNKLVMTGHKCSPLQQTPRDGPSFPGVLRVPPAPPRNNPVNLPLSFSSAPLSGPHSGAPENTTISLPTKWFQPPVELLKTDVAVIADILPLMQSCYKACNAVNKSDNLSHFSGLDDKRQIYWTQTEFARKQFVKRIRQAIYSVFNKWKSLWVAGSMETKHWSIIQG
jgi:hypothetical protein